MTRAHRRPTRAHRLRRDEGTVTAFTVTVLFALLAVTGLVVDAGRALTADVQAQGQAEDAARAGAQDIDLARLRTDGTVVLQPAQAQHTATAYLAGEGATGTATATNEQVTVAVTGTVHTTLLTLVGVTTLHVHGQATAHAARTTP
ncbi:TadE/TadG family type IV pilus assembly protein [Streptacidiphilus monticola]|uniref:TadE/TadG family type IV pilus assembly protein n=1 Tax=Streptacidiphilus monticola TaxID=2161674 RepID=A0ABW1GCV1_9ACTN